MNVLFDINYQVTALTTETEIVWVLNNRWGQSEHFDEKKNKKKNVDGLEAGERDTPNGHTSRGSIVLEIFVSNSKDFTHVRKQFRSREARALKISFFEIEDVSDYFYTLS